MEENIASALNVFPLPPGGTAAKRGRQCFRGEMNFVGRLKRLQSAAYKRERLVLKKDTPS